MANTLQAEGIPRQAPRKQSAVVVLTALGVVYGDIGTSTLYGLKQAVDAGGGPSPEAVMGIVSLIFWALLLIVGLKYAILILRADNHGEGGIVALLALLDARHAPRGSPRAGLLIATGRQNDVPSFTSVTRDPASPLPSLAPPFWRSRAPSGYR